MKQIIVGREWKQVTVNQSDVAMTCNNIEKRNGTVSHIIPDNGDAIIIWFEYLTADKKV